MAKSLINTIQKVLVEGQKIAVILTTHSPSTVALAPDASLYEMDPTGPRVNKISKSKALSLLTSGVPTLAKLNGNTQLADAMARTKPSHKLNFSKYLLNEVNGKWTLSVVNDQVALQRESARRLAALGGSDPDIQAIPRRQSKPA